VLGSVNQKYPILSFEVIRCQGGADVNFADKKRATTLHKAAFNGNLNVTTIFFLIDDILKCVELLLAKRADVNAKDTENTTPLHNAVYNGHTQVVQVLLENGADVGCWTAKYRSTPLHFAAFNGYLDCMKVFGYSS
jgi:ankyrin repeat protein